MKPRPPVPPKHKLGSSPPSSYARTHLTFAADEDLNNGALVVGGHHGAEVVNSAQELEERFPLSTLRHAAHCVGLDYDADIQGTRTATCIGSLAEIEPADMFALLAPHHDDASLLRQLVDIVSGNVEIDDMDEELSATHMSRRQSMSAISVGEAEQRDFVVRLHKIYRNPNESVPLEVVKSAEVALRRYNAKQKESESSLRRIYHACLQLEEQQRKYSRHNIHNAAGGRPHSAPSARAGSAATEGSNGSEHGGGGGSGCSRHPTDAVGKLLIHLRRQAISERNNIRREIVIRAQTNADIASNNTDNIRAKSVSGASSSSNHLLAKHHSTESDGGDDATLVSARRHRKAASIQNAFREELDAFRKQCEEREEEKRRRDEANALAEYKLASAMSNAERRRYEFLRNRELRIRATSERAEAVSAANRERARIAEKEAEERKREELLTLKEDKLKSMTEEQQASETRKASKLRRQQEALERARALKQEKEQLALQQEQQYKERVQAHENDTTRKAAIASVHHREVEQRRKDAVQKAKRLEEQRVKDAESLRTIIDTDMERRKRQTAYLKSIKDEENKIKDGQRRRLVQQYAKAREYREDAFRSQWESELQRRQSEEQQRKQLASSLHQLQLREEAKLRGIIGSRQFNQKDIEKLNLFIAEIDALTAAPSLA